MTTPISFLGPIAYALPNKVVTNEDLKAENPLWDMEGIAAKSGVLSRHISDKQETSFDLSVAACQKLFTDKAIDPKSVDGLICCTQSPDYIMPSNSHLLHKHFALSDQVTAFDINLACSGYVYGLGIAHSLLCSGLVSNCLLVTADTYSKYINSKDRSARVLFGDGAAATLVSNNRSGGQIIDIQLCSHGKEFDKFYIPAGGIRTPKSGETKIESTDRNGNVRCLENIHMDGLAVWSFINSAIPEHINGLLKRNNLDLSNIDQFIFHQASQMTLESLVKVLNIPKQKAYINFKDTGNLVSASIPVALSKAIQDKAICPGNKVLLCGFGVGLSYGSVLLQF